MPQSTNVQIGAGLMVLGSLAMVVTLFGIDLPLIVLSIAILLLAAGTVLVGTSDVGPGEHPV